MVERRVRHNQQRSGKRKASWKLELAHTGAPLAPGERRKKSGGGGAGRGQEGGESSKRQTERGREPRVEGLPPQRLQWGEKKSRGKAKEGDSGKCFAFPNF